MNLEAHGFVFYFKSWCKYWELVLTLTDILVSWRAESCCRVNITEKRLMPCFSAERRRTGGAGAKEAEALWGNVCLQQGAGSPRSHVRHQHAFHRPQNGGKVTAQTLWIHQSVNTGVFTDPKSLSVSGKLSNMEIPNQGVQVEGDGSSHAIRLLK